MVISDAIVPSGLHEEPAVWSSSRCPCGRVTTLHSDTLKDLFTTKPSGKLEKIRGELLCISRQASLQYSLLSAGQAEKQLAHLSLQYQQGISHRLSKSFLQRQNRATSD